MGIKNIIQNKTTFIIVFIVALLLYIAGFLSSYPYLINTDNRSFSIFDTTRNILEYSIMFSSLMVFCWFLLGKNIFTKISAYLLILILSLNFMLSASCFFIYTDGFNVGMMLSIMETNINESFSMVKTFIPPIISTLFFFILLVFLFTQNKTFNEKIIRNKKIKIILSILWILSPTFFYFKHKYIKNNGGG